MPTIIASFGYRHGVPQLESGATVIDVRREFMRNPFHNKELRSLRGDDPLVEADILKTPNFQHSYEDLKRIVSKCIGPVYLGCTGGHHRSVYLADRLARELAVEVLHLNYRDA